MAGVGGARWRDATGSRLVLACAVGEAEARLLMARQDDVFHFHLVLPLTVAPSACANFAEAVCVINAQLALAGFGFERDSGSVYFRVSVPVSTDGLPDELAVHLVETCVATAQQYWSQLVDHIIAAGRSKPSRLTFAFARLSPPPGLAKA